MFLPTSLPYQNLVGLVQRRSEPIHIVPAIVKCKRGPAGGRRAEALMQRHGAVGAGANRHAVLVDYERDDMGVDDMIAPHLE
jgi:hypothetical protein